MTALLVLHPSLPISVINTKTTYHKIYFNYCTLHIYSNNEKQPQNPPYRSVRGLLVNTYLGVVRGRRQRLGSPEGGPHDESPTTICKRISGSCGDRREDHPPLGRVPPQDI